MQITKPVHLWQCSFQGEWPSAVTFLNDGNSVAAANRAGDLYLWKLPDAPPEEKPDPKDKNKENTPPGFSPQRKLIGHTNGISHLISLNKGNSLVSASLDKTIRIWDMNAKADGKTEVILNQFTREKNARYAPKAKKEEILNAPGISLETSSASSTLTGHSEWIKALGMSADESRLISGDDACVAIVWDLKTGKKVSSWTGYDRVWITTASLSPDGKTAFTSEFIGSRSSFDRPAAQARLWNADDGTLKQDLLKVWTPKVKEKDRIDSYGYAQTWGKLMKRGLVCSAFSPDGKLLAAGQGGETNTGQVHIIDVNTGKILRTISGHKYGVCDLKFSDDGKYVLSSGRDTTVRICQVADGKEVATLGTSRGGQFKDWISAIAISPDQKRVAGADIAGFVHIWQL